MTRSGEELARKRASYKIAERFRCEKSPLPEEYLVPRNRAVRIYCDGIFDLFHYGHMRMLEQAKNLFPRVTLIVGVCGDKVTEKKKGATVMTMKERAEGLWHCKWVDEVVLNAPWKITPKFLRKHRIDYVAHDDASYSSGDEEDIYSFVKESGQFIPTVRTEGISTSELITRIIRSYDTFIKRNLERGITAESMNISVFTEKRVRVTNKLRVLREKLRDFREFWERVSSDLGDGFGRIFDRNKK